MYLRRRVASRVVEASAVALLTFAVAAEAQVTVGENVKMNLSGNLGVGYSGDFGNAGVSSHGLFGTGMGIVSGSYYNPNFLSFTVRPFYDRNQDNSSSTSVLSETGVDASTSIFGGSHFPGSLSFSKAFTRGSQYGIPGSVNLDSNSDTQTFSVSWSELLPDLPSLTATFSDSSDSSTILGESGTNDISTKVFSLLSNYKVHGFQFLGYMNHQNYHVDLPVFLSAGSPHSDAATTSYSISANHSLPLSGMFTLGYNRTNYDSQTGSYRNHGTTDTADGMVSLRPVDRLTVSGEVRYTGNLIGALRQSYLAGSTANLFANDQTSQGVVLSTYETYRLGHGFTLIGYANRQMETFAGKTYDYNQAGGTLTYSYARPLFGLLYFTFGMVNNGTTSGGNSLGFVGSATLKRSVHRWEYSADFSYSQNVQSVIANYTTSGFNYGGTLRRRFATNMVWTGSYRGTQTAITQIAGTTNRADSFVTTLVEGRYDLSASYSKSHGMALLSSSGTLTPAPVAPLLTPDQVIYDGKVYGAGMSVTPIRKMLINFNWFRVRSETTTASVLSQNKSERYYAQMQYNLRKLSFRAGYWRVDQGIGTGVLRPTLDNTYFFNLSRWFDLF